MGFRLGTTVSPVSAWNVKCFGALGDGVTDDSVVINATIALATGSTLYFPVGTYLINSPITIPSGVHARLENGAVIKKGASATFTCNGTFEASSPSCFNNFTDSDLTFSPTATKEPHFFSATVGAESSNLIQVAVQMRNVYGAPIAVVKEILLESFALTDGQGHILAATPPLGTMVRSHSEGHPGICTAYFRSTSTGAFAFAIEDTLAEECLVTLIANGCCVYSVKLTFT